MTRDANSEVNGQGLDERAQGVQDGRAGVFALFSTLCGYPMEEWQSDVETLLSDKHIVAQLDSVCPYSAQKLSNLIHGAEPNAVRAEYIDLFDRGAGRNPLYESAYGPGRGANKGAVLADIAGFYRAFGLNFGTEELAHEMLDHVAVELEFYALLLLKESLLAQAGDISGADIVTDARCKFLEDHLGAFVRAIAERPEVQHSPMYGPIFACCRDLVAHECARVGARPTILEWAGRQRDSEELSCGGAELITKIGSIDK